MGTVTPASQQVIKVVDSTGRIIIGKNFIGKNCMIQELEDGSVLITPVVLIPERELWIWQNASILQQLDSNMNEINSRSEKDNSEIMTIDELIDL